MVVVVHGLVVLLMSFISDKVSNISLNYKDETFNANIAVFGSDDKRANFSTALFTQILSQKTYQEVLI